MFRQFRVFQFYGGSVVAVTETLSRRIRNAEQFKSIINTLASGARSQIRVGERDPRDGRRRVGGEAGQCLEFGGQTPGVDGRTHRGSAAG